MSDEDKKQPLAPETRPSGRALFAVIAVCSAVFLILLGSQTEPGFENGGWWNEPRNAPLFSLTLLFASSFLAAVFAAPAQTDGLLREAGVAVVLSGAFLAAVWLIPIAGYALSVLLFSAVAGLIAGYRGRTLMWVSFGMTVLMLVMFRYALGLWFPRAELFKLAPWLETLGGYL